MSVPSFKSKDAKKIKEFEIKISRKGFSASSYINNNVFSQEYFLFAEIQQIIHYPGTGVEIINHSGKRRVFYNDETGGSLNLFNELHKNMITWLQTDAP